MAKIRNFDKRIWEAYNSYFTKAIVKVADDSYEIRHVLHICYKNGHERSYVLTNAEYEDAYYSWLRLY